VLFYLAFLANTEPNHRGKSSQQFLAPRDFTVTIAHRRGILTWSYPAGTITPAEARTYLTILARDLLGPDAFDLLPIELILKNPELRQIYSPRGSRLSPEDCVHILEDAIEDSRENSFGFQVPLLVDMIAAKVPADALAKIQRRFTLIDRGP